MGARGMCASWAEQGALRQDTSNKQHFKPCVLSLPGAFLRDYLSAIPTVSSKSLTAFLALLCPLQQGKSQARGPLPWLGGLPLLPTFLSDVEKSGCGSLEPHSWRRRSRGGKAIIPITLHQVLPSPLPPIKNKRAKEGEQELLSH